jgi:hypothetical protein
MFLGPSLELFFPMSFVTPEKTDHIVVGQRLDHNSIEEDKILTSAPGFAKPRHRWIDNIKIDLLEIGLSVVDWIYCLFLYFTITIIYWRHHSTLDGYY